MCKRPPFLPLWTQFSHQTGLHPFGWKDTQQVGVFRHWSVAQHSGHASQSAVWDLLDVSRREKEPHCRSWTRAGCPGPLWRFSGVSAPHVQCYTAPQPPLWWVSGGTNDNFGCKRSHRWPRIISFSLGDSGRLGSVCKRSWRRTGLQCCCWGVSNVLTRKMLLREENQQDGKTMSSWRFLLSS